MLAGVLLGTLVFLLGTAFGWSLIQTMLIAALLATALALFRPDK